jgi:hypothetical protein
LAKGEPASYAFGAHWDTARLAQMVKPDVQVLFQN